MSESYVFVSYARQDQKFVDKLIGKLHRAGVRTWIDRENIAAGQNWARAIDHALLDAKVLIYVASRQSAQSRWMDAEYTAFLQRGHRVIPIVIDDDGPINLPQPLQQLQWVDFRGPFEPALGLLLDGIRDLRASEPVVATKPKSKGYAFISYADEDKNFVDKLKLFLKKRGYGFWDYRDSARDYQIDYTLELENIIRNAEATLSVVSPEWKRSRTAIQELHFSREVETPVFLLKVRDPGPTLTISGMTYIDFIGDKNAGFTQLDGEMLKRGL